ncbi:MAG TPA: GspMb/PilO family protein [Candidatus Dormibacteraeota bacterium]|nr:GspMb/PilO family protein [Candidatus Dormibacteraeota bacterium]
MSGRGKAWKRWKRWVQISLIVLFALDAGLAAQRWRMGVASSEEQLQLRQMRLRAEVAALQANLNHAEAVKRSIPKIAVESSRFYDEELLGPSQGYAELVGDLGTIAQNAGLETSGVRFSQKSSSEHGVTEVDATAVIEGNYEGLIRFINGLERSKNFYVLDSLELASSTGGQVKLNIRLHTYFRT